MTLATAEKILREISRLDGQIVHALAIRQHARTPSNPDRVDLLRQAGEIARVIRERAEEIAADERLKSEVEGAWLVRLRIDAAEQLERDAIADIQTIDAAEAKGARARKRADG